MKKIIYSEKAPKPVGAYSQAVEVNGLLFCSGQISIDPATNEVITGDIQKQTRQVMANIQALLESQGLSMQNIVKTGIFLTDMADFAKVNEIYSSYFPKEPPARSTVAVFALPKGVNVEIEIIACRS